MNVALMAMLTLAGLFLLSTWFSKTKVTIASIGDLFMLMWFYYGFSMAIDVMLGFEIPYTSGAPDFADANYHSYVVISLAMFMACGITFFLSYQVTQPTLSVSSQIAFRESSSGARYLPPLWLLLALHLGLLVSFGGEYFYLSRQERGLLLDGSIYFRMLMLLLVCTKALDVLYIILSPSRITTAAVALIASTLGILSGDRSDFVVVVICLLLKYRFACSRRLFVCLAILAIVVFGTWKAVYTYTIETVLYGEPDWKFVKSSSSCLSGIESYGSHVVLTTYLQEDCPYWLGSSYITQPFLMSLPRSLRGDSEVTLSQSFTSEYHPEVAKRGGSFAFSALAESWLNFGYYGPLLLGAFWGITAKRFDTGRRGIAFFVFAFITFRLFRSDVASLWKSWVIIFGGSMMLTYLLMRLVKPVRFQRNIKMRSRPLRLESGQR